MTKVFAKTASIGLMILVCSLPVAAVDSIGLEKDITRSLNNYFSAQFKPLLNEQKKLKEFQVNQCLFTPEAKTEKAINDFPRMTDLTVFIKQQRFDLEKSVSPVRDFYVAGDIRFGPPLKLLAGDEYTQFVTRSTRLRVSGMSRSGLPQSGVLRMSGKILPFKKHVCTLKNDDGSVRETIKGFKADPSSSKVGSNLLGMHPTEFNLKLKGNSKGFSRQLNRVRLESGTVELTGATYRRLPGENVPGCGHNFYRTAEKSFHRFDQPVVIKAATVVDERVEFAKAEYPISNNGEMTLTYPFYGERNVISSDIFFHATLKFDDGEKPLRGIRYNVIGSSTAPSLSIHRRIAQSFSVGYKSQDNSDRKFTIRLNPSEADLTIVDAERASDNNFLLVSNQRYIASFSFESSKKTDFSQQSIRVRDALSTYSSRAGAAAFSVLEPTEIKFTYADNRWQALFDVALEDKNETLSSLFPIQTKPAPMNVSGEKYSLHLQKPALENLVFEGRPGENKDAKFQKEFDLFFGAGFEVDEKRTKRRDGRDSFTMLAFGDLDNGDSVEPSPVRIFNQYLVVVEEGDEVLSRENDGYVVNSQGVGAAELNLFLATKFIPPGLIDNGQDNLEADNKLIARVNKLRLIKGQTIQKFTRDELDAQRLELAGDLFAPEDINDDQLQRQQLKPVELMLIANGPINMSQYTVDWVSGGATQSKFVREGANWVSYANLNPDASASLEHVILKDPEGNPVGEFSDFGLKKILTKAPEITLLMPVKPTAGEVTNIKAVIRNLPEFDFKGEVFCRWSIDKANEIDVINAGIFREEITAVNFASSNMSVCKNQLVLHNVTQNVGSSPPVTVQLIHDGGVKL